MNQQKKKAIFDAFAQIVQYQRFHEVTMDDIALAAGVGKGTIYRYFQNKETLFFEFALIGFEETAVAIEQLAAQPFTEKIIDVLAILESFLAKRHSTMHVFRELEERIMCLQSERKRRLADKRKRVREALAQVYLQGQQENIIDARYSASVLAEHTLHLLIGRRHWPEDVVLPSMEDVWNFIGKGCQSL